MLCFAFHGRSYNRLDCYHHVSSYLPRLGRVAFNRFWNTVRPSTNFVVAICYLRYPDDMVAMIGLRALKFFSVLFKSDSLLKVCVGNHFFTALENWRRRKKLRAKLRGRSWYYLWYRDVLDVPFWSGQQLL